MRRLVAVALVLVVMGWLAPTAQAGMSKRKRARLGAALIVLGAAVYAYAPQTVDRDKVEELENRADWADFMGLPYTARGYREEADDERDKASQMRLGGSLMVLGGLVALGSAAVGDDRGSALRAFVPAERRTYLRVNTSKRRVECVYRVRF